MIQGFLAMVLHAHLPYVRHPEHEHFLEENWFHEAVTETYLPLLWTFERLLEDDVDFRITFNLLKHVEKLGIDLPVEGIQ